MDDYNRSRVARWWGHAHEKATIEVALPRRPGRIDRRAWDDDSARPTRTEERFSIVRMRKEGSDAPLSLVSTSFATNGAVEARPWTDAVVTWRGESRGECGAELDYPLLGGQRDQPIVIPCQSSLLYPTTP